MTKKYHCPTGVSDFSLIDSKVNSETVCRIESLTCMTPKDEEEILTCDHCRTMYDVNLSPEGCPAIHEVCLGEVGKIDTDQLKADALEAGSPEPVFVQRTIGHTPFNEKTGEEGKTVNVDVVCLVIHESAYDQKTEDQISDDTTMDDAREFEQYLATV